MKKTFFATLSIAVFLSMNGCSCEGGSRPLPPENQPKSISNSPGDFPENYAHISNQATDDKADTIKPTPCVFNVYVENSGSMYGYVKGATNFENSVYSYLSDINNSDMCSQMNLNYINSIILRCQPDVADFIYRLEPESFKMKGGNQISTDISSLIGKILENHGKDTVSILISDFVFSPGQGRNAEEYLINQQVGIKNQIVKERKINPHLSFMIYRLTSNFNGKYYDQNNTPYVINHERPFYIMLFGNQEDLNRLTKEVSKDAVKGSGVLNSYSLSPTNSKVSYGIITSPRIGSFKPNPKAPLSSVVNSKIDRKAPGPKFVFSIGADFSELLLEDDYLMNSDNYKVSNPAYMLEIEKSQNAQYTHTIKICLNPQLQQIARGSLTISLLKRQSDWAEKYTIMDDTGLDKITTDKTYGFKYLVDGIYEGFDKDSIYTEIKLNIN